MAAYLLPFEAPTLKLRWAREHMNKLDGFLRTYHDSKPYRIRREEGCFVVERVGSIPSEIALTLGDAIHNLRTALDLLATDLVRVKGKSPKGVYFPFAEDSAALRRQIAAKNFDRAGPEAVRLLRQFGPYPSGNPMLRALHDLDVMDKHKLIVPVMHGLRAYDIELNGPTGRLHLAELEGRGDGFSLTAQEGDTLRVGRFDLVAIFSEDAPKPLHNRPVQHVLADLADLVENLIQTFRNRCGPIVIAEAGAVQSSGNTTSNESVSVTIPAFSAAAVDIE